MSATAAVPSGARVAPGPDGQPILGSIRNVRKDPLNFLLRMRAQYGDVVRLRFGPRTSHLVAHPSDILHVLGQNSRNYLKGSQYEKLEVGLGQGLLTSEGELWRRQRRTMDPYFHAKQLATFADMMVDATLTMLARWALYTDSGEPLNVAAEMMRLTLTIVGHALFSTDVSDEASEVGWALPIVLRQAERSMLSFINLPLAIPTPGHRRFQEALETLDRIVYAMIAERRHSGPNGDLLSKLVFARDEETGAAMSDKQLRDEVMTLFLAGHETTANALAWTFYLLSKHPAIARRLRAELDDVLGGRPPQLDDLDALVYTRQVVEESMRLYPPAPVIGRHALDDDEVGGYHIPAGTDVLISQYVTHRHPEFWDNPEGFDPERHTPEHTAERPPFAFFPFGGGPRRCIGDNFAMLEVRLVLATVAQRYEVDLVPGHRVEPEVAVTLRPATGILMAVRRTRPSLRDGSA